MRYFNNYLDASRSSAWPAALSCTTGCTRECVLSLPSWWGPPTCARSHPKSRRPPPNCPFQPGSRTVETGWMGGIECKYRRAKLIAYPSHQFDFPIEPLDKHDHVSIELNNLLRNSRKRYSTYDITTIWGSSPGKGKRRGALNWGFTFPAAGCIMKSLF